jgi:hypothetical protein
LVDFFGLLVGFLAGIDWGLIEFVFWWFFARKYAILHGFWLILIGLFDFLQEICYFWNFKLILIGVGWLQCFCKGIADFGWFSWIFARNFVIIDSFGCIFWNVGLILVGNW